MLGEQVQEFVMPWYADQARNDGARLAMLRHTIFGAPAPNDRERVTFGQLRNAASFDPTVFRVFCKVMGMVARPEDIYTDPAVVARTHEVIVSHGAGPPIAQPLVLRDCGCGRLAQLALGGGRCAGTVTLAGRSPGVSGVGSCWLCRSPACRRGDTLVITKLDRLARSVPDARDIVDDLTGTGVKLTIGGSVHDPTDPIGRLLVTTLSMIAEFEADLAQARTREGMAVARAKGRLRGKQPKLSPRQEAHLVELYRAGAHTIGELAELFPITRSTIYRAVARADRRAAVPATKPGS